MIHRLHIFCSTLAACSVLMACSGDDDEPGVERDEGIYINEIYSSSGNDWLEIYNHGDAEADIGGYFIYDDAADKYELPAGTKVAAKGFLVLFCDETADGLHTNFRLSADGETVFFENVSHEVIDKVMFPALKDGEVYGRFPDGSVNFGTSGIPTQGSANGDIRAAVIRNVSNSPLVVRPGDEVTIQAEVFSNDGLSSVTLFYKTDGGSFTGVPMTANGNIYQGSIPAVDANATVYYYISASNNNNQTTLHPFDAPGETHSYIVNNDALPMLRINEFMASNVSCCPDVQNGTDEFDDWIEIYNAGTTSIDLAGMYLSDNPDNPFKSRIPGDDPAATTIAPGGFLIIWADEQAEQGPAHANFKLSAAGEYIGLFYRDGRTIDEYTFTGQAENRSSGLSTDGGATWIVFPNPTPGLSNY